LDFEDAVLVDDGLDNLRVFTQLGGRGVPWSGDASLSDVASAIRAWLDELVSRRPTAAPRRFHLGPARDRE
jgi:hypothetical protein